MVSNNDTGTKVLLELKLWCLASLSTIFIISVVSWQSASLIEETGVPRENHWPAASHWQTLAHNVVSSTPLHERDSTSHLWWWYSPIALVVVNPTTIRSWPRRPLQRCCKYYKQLIQHSTRWSTCSMSQWQLLNASWRHGANKLIMFKTIG